MIQRSFLPDNDQPEPTVKRASDPLVKLIDGRWCWKVIDRDEYVPAPELEAILLAAQSEQRKAA
jgi:hypothetical protein